MQVHAMLMYHYPMHITTLTLMRTHTHTHIDYEHAAYVHIISALVCIHVTASHLAIH